MWMYGKEAWCNLQGRYTQFVFDLSDRTAEDAYEISICSLGVLGTRYEREIALPTTLQGTVGNTYEILIAPILSVYTIGNVLDVKVRQKPGSELSWVTIS